MEKQNNTPRLRFPEFTGDWVEKSFGELYQKNNVKNDLSFGVDKIISVANMYYKSDAVVGDEDYLRSYNIFRVGDIAYEGNKSANYAYGRFVENTIGDGIVSHVFDVYSPVSSDHCIDYWKYAINYEGIMRPILEKSTIKSTMMTNLIAKDFLKQKILVPPTLAEQEKIASVLMEADAMIAAQGQKVDALKNKKKGLMQQLFPQDGETTPRFRFPGFSGEWRECELGQMCSVNRGVRVTRKDLPDEGQYPVFQNTNTPMGFHNVFNVGANNPFVIIGGSAGLVGFSNTEFWAADDCVYFGDCVDLDKYFLYSTLIVHLREIKSHVRGGNVPRLERKVLEKLKIRLPEKAEQQEIASCLSELDTIIASESAKLEALKEHKNGLMQNLFPQPVK